MKEKYLGKDILVLVKSLYVLLLFVFCLEKNLLV